MKAPAVVRRPVPSISCRSMIRTGETVLVPIGSSLTRCGISDPVIKIARSSTFCLGFEAWLMFGSASTVPANSAAIIAVAVEDIRVFTTNKVTPAKVVCANYRNDEDGPFLQKQERAVALATAPSRTKLKSNVRIFSLGARKRTGQWHRK